MKLCRFLVCILLAISQLIFPGVKPAQTEVSSEVEQSPQEEPKFQLYARSAVLMDASSGRVLYEKDGSTHMPNASTTKIMTAILAIESGKMEESATVSAYAASQPQVRLGKGSSFGWAICCIP